MFSIEVHGADELVAKLDRYTKQIEDEGKDGLPDEVLEWQREDMKRKYPNQQTGQLGNGTETFVLTTIWPRSRTYVRKSGSRPKKFAPRFSGPRRVASGRPILRQELYDKLMERGRELLRKAMQWR